MSELTKKVLVAALAVVAVSSAAAAMRQGHAPTTTATPLATTSPAGPPSPSASPARAPVHVVDILGDSYAAGSGTTTVSKGFVALTAARMGWIIRPHAEGGTGYLADGRVNDPKFGPLPSRVQEVIANHPDLVIVEGGLNDQPFPAVKVGAAAAQLLARIKTALPGTRVLVIGPFSPTRPAPAAELAVRDSIRAVAASSGDTFIDPIAEKWLDPKNIGPDGQHPTDAGHAQIAAGLVRDLHRLGF